MTSSGLQLWTLSFSGRQLTTPSTGWRPLEAAAGRVDNLQAGLGCAQTPGKALSSWSQTAVTRPPPDTSRKISWRTRCLPRDPGPGPAVSPRHPQWRPLGAISALRGSCQPA